MSECLSKCLSPIACEGFGYCRERNQPQTEDGVSWLRYARHGDVERLTGDGWAVAGDLGMPHAHYAVLMKWAGEGEPT
jgi:hypothetical protein